MATWKAKLVAKGGPKKGDVQEPKLRGPLTAGTAEQHTQDDAWWHFKAIANGQRQNAINSGAPDPELEVESVEEIKDIPVTGPFNGNIPEPGGKPIDMHKFDQTPPPTPGDDDDDE